MKEGVQGARLDVDKSDTWTKVYSPKFRKSGLWLTVLSAVTNTGP